MTTPQGSTTLDQKTYWNEGGGRRWVSNLDAVERMFQPFVEQLLALAAPRPGERVIDVGCGGGETSRALATAVAPTGEVLGLDVSSVILEAAAARHRAVPGLRFLLGDAGSIALPAGSFDLITSRFGVMFFPEPVAAFSHLRRLLKPDGRLHFICWQPLVLNPWMGVPADAAFSVFPRPAPTAPNMPGPFGLSDEKFLRGVLDGAGFSRVQIASHACPLDLGPLDDAVAQMTRMGPAAPLFDEADESTHERAMSALRAALSPAVQVGRVHLGSHTWQVSARV